MILKKPYAFLIKHFRLINFLLAALAGFIVYKTYSIVNFFTSYVNNNYSGSFYAGFYHEYISPIVILSFLLILFGIAAICLLFLYKKKLNKPYLFSLIFYIILFIYFIIIRNSMIGMQSVILTAEVARIYRDISTLAMVPQVFYIILFVMRFFGFNIGKFNFQEDLKALQVSEGDNEEVEITIKQDGTKIKRVFRRFLREFKYYIKENKFIFILICLGSAVLIGFLIYNALPDIVDYNYRQGDIFYMNDITYRIEDSIITNLDYKGDVITKDKYYVVIKLYVENNSSNDFSINYDNYRLEINKEYLYPVKGKGSKFIDYAKDNSKNVVKVNSKNIYSIVYEIDSKDIKKSYRLKINNGTAISDNVSVGKFNYVTITPIIIDKVTDEGTIKVGEELNLSGSNLGNSTFKINNVFNTSKYIYEYEKCELDVCNNYKDIITINYTNNNKILMVMDYEYKLDKEVPFYNNATDINKFVDNFIKIKYLEGEEVKYAKVKNVTPKNMKSQIAIETDKDIENAKELYVVISIRNKEYNIQVK